MEKFNKLLVNQQKCLLILLVLVSFSNALFTNDFRAFLHNRYGLEIVNFLERGDLGEDASFGGRFDGFISDKEPVIIVHGITNKITRFQNTIEALKARGYTFSADIYGTTYGDAGLTIAGLVEMKCNYVKQIRSLIIAVREYTGKKVDIIAYSMGSPIARKAIMGGYCVDTREILGPTLTDHIDTFLSVAGSNNGAILCFVPIPVGTCNKRNGLHCESEFLADINSQKRYEGEYIFSVFSTADDKVGFRTCNQLASPIRGEDGFVKRDGLNHDQIMDTTHEIQINFITKHRPR